MGKTGRNDVGSVVVDLPTGPAGGGSNVGHFKSSWSTASFRRMILDALSCGGGSGGGGGRHSRKSTVEEGQKQPEPKPRESGRSLRWELTRDSQLSEILRQPEQSDGEEAEEVKKKMEVLEKLKRVVKKLQQQEEEEEQHRSDTVLEAAMEVRKLTKDNSEARTTLALLGAIPPLVALLDDVVDLSSQIAALYALLNLAIANDANKAAIVKAGAVHKMLKLIQQPNRSVDSAVSEAIVANFLGLSALDSNKPIIGSSGAIPFLVKTLKEFDETSSSQVRHDALRALYNLSISPSNVFPILDTDLIPFLMSKLGDMDVSERILSILSNVVSIPEGRKAISDVRDVFPILIDVLNWTDSPGCQEKVSYILMVMAHKAYGDRQAMIDAGIASSLLELTLLGSTLAQKRASRILECLRVDKGKQVSESYGGGLTPNVSAPQCGSSGTSSSNPSHRLQASQDEDNDIMSEERKAVKQLVQQSLQNNMKRIAKRANLPQDFVPSDHFKALTSSSTSKSLPF